MAQRIIDLSQPLGPETPAFPGDPPLQINILDSTNLPSPAGRRLNSSQISLSLHCGTHMDAPFHFFQDAPTIDQVSLDRCFGPALLVRLNPRTVDEPIEAHDLASFEEQIRTTKRIVLNTGWHSRWGSPEYFQDYPALSGGAARFLVDCGVQLVGVDTPSVDRPPFDAHVALLGNGVLIVENLTNLDEIEVTVFQLAAIPLRISGRDGSPVRAIALM